MLLTMKQQVHNEPSWFKQLRPLKLVQQETNKRQVVIFYPARFNHRAGSKHVAPLFSSIVVGEWCKRLVWSPYIDLSPLWQYDCYDDQGDDDDYGDYDYYDEYANYDDYGDYDYYDGYDQHDGYNQKTIFRK